MNGYVIVDESKATWVCKDTNGAYSLTTDKNKAVIFESKPAADKVFKSNLSKLIKSKGVTVKAVTLQIAGANNEPKNTSVGANNSHIQPVTTVTSNHMIGSSEYIISVLSDAVNKLNHRHAFLIEEQSKYDRQRTDVEHYIELNMGKLNACDGYKAYKLLQDVLVERRKVKDELQIIQAVRDRIEFPDELAKIDTHIQALKERRYEPRELAYLFDGKEKKS